jgi:hypothetical protein
MSVKRRTMPDRAGENSRPRGAKRSAAAAKADAAERARIQRMSPLERALLALDLGERFRAFVKPDP